MGNQMSARSAADWDCWSPDGASNPPVLDVEACGDLYLADIRSVTNGIVLMHDPYFIDNDPMKGGTVDMVQYIVPILKAEGFSFVRVDEVPAIAAALPPLTVPDASESLASSSSGSSTAAPDTTTTPGAPASGDSPEPCPPSPHDKGQ
jgi:hypothetical protein